jgi:hypothetical protein
MARTSKSEQVPKQMQETYKAITTVTDAFCQTHLNEEYAQLARQATAALCRKRPSPLSSGRPESWACGIVHALGLVNFLYDKSQTPSMTAAELYEGFGVKPGTGGAKSKAVRDTLKMHPMDTEWCLPSRIDQNPLAWLITVNGFFVDARDMPREVQEIAFEKGLIPYIPDDKPESDQSAG